MIPLSACDRFSLQISGLTGCIRNSTLARYRSAEASAEQLMRKQREARLQQPHLEMSYSENIPFIRTARFPQRWTDE